MWRKAVGLLLGNSLFFLASSAMSAPLPDVPFLVQCQADMSLDKCFAEVAKATRITIECQGCPGQPLGQDILMQYPLVNAVQSALGVFNVTNYGYDYTEVDKKLTISIVNSPSKEPAKDVAGADKPNGFASPPGVTDSQFPNEAEFQGRRPVPLQLDDIVIPPMGPGEQGISLREANAMFERELARRQPIDPAQEIVIPPDGSNAKGFTFKEMHDALQTNKEAQDDPSDQVVVPPMNGEPGITAREFEAGRKAAPDAKTNDASVSSPTFNPPPF